MNSLPWQPGVDRATLKARADLLASVRAFFHERGVLEVTTPVLGRYGVTDEHIDNIAVPGYGWLQSSPEYAMKRLLAAGAGAIYQIGPVFRDGEAGRRHNPEFTLLEWYRPDFELAALIDECLALLGTLRDAPVARHRFRRVFAGVTGLDPLTADTGALAEQARRTGAPAGLNRAQAVDYLMATEVEPALDPEAFTVISDFPGWAAALAETDTDRDGATVARRFEIYHRGLELANGYQELRDPAEQARRFAADNGRRRATGKPEREADPRLLAALEHGLPRCSGVALGVERLHMALAGAERIDQVLPFPWGRA